MDGPGIESLWEAKFSAFVQTGHGAHPASCTVGTCSFLGVKGGQGVALKPHHLLVPRSKKSRAIPLLPLWAVQPVQSLSVSKEPQCLYSTAIPLLPLLAVRPVQSLSACTVQLYLYSPYGPYGLYRASVPVQYSYTSTPPMDRTACTEPQCLHKGALSLLHYLARSKFTYKTIRVAHPIPVVLHWEILLLKWRNAVPGVLGNCQCNNRFLSTRCAAVAWQKVAEVTVTKSFVDLVTSQRYWVPFDKVAVLVKMRNCATPSLLRNFLAKETKTCSLAYVIESFCFVISLRYEPTIETRWDFRDVCPSVRQYV